MRTARDSLILAVLWSSERRKPRAVDDGSGDATRLLGLAGLAVERVALTPLGIRVVQLVTADPDAAR